MLLIACRFLHEKVFYNLKYVIFVEYHFMFDNFTFFTIFMTNFSCVQLFVLACARAHACQSEHNSECWNKVYIAYIMNHIL